MQCTIYNFLSLCNESVQQRRYILEQKVIILHATYVSSLVHIYWFDSDQKFSANIQSVTDSGYQITVKE